MVINMCEYNNVPKIRFKGFTDVWEQRKLGEIINETIDNRGKNPPYYCESGIPIIDNFMIKNNGYPDLKIATRYLDDYLFSNFIRKYNEKDDVLITLVGNGIGNIALFPKEKSAIVQNTIGMRFEHPKKFKYYSLLSKNNEIVKLDRGMAQPSIRQDELKNLDINLPTEKEQSKIESLMTNLDNLITLHHRKYTYIFYSWEQRKLGDLMDITSVKRIHQSDWTESGIRFIRARDIVADYKKEEVEDKLYISKEKYEEYSLISGKVQIGDLLVTGVGTIGIPYLIRNNEPIYFKDGNIIWFKNNNKIDDNFLYYSFVGSKIQNFINEKSGVGTVGTYTIQSGKETPIMLTNNNEQGKISNLMSNLDNLITLHQHKELKRRNDNNEHLRW